MTNPPPCTNTTAGTGRPSRPSGSHTSRFRSSPSTVAYRTVRVGSAVPALRTGTRARGRETGAPSRCAVTIRATVGTVALTSVRPTTTPVTSAVRRRRSRYSATAAPAPSSPKRNNSITNQRMVSSLKYSRWNFRNAVLGTLFGRRFLVRTTVLTKGVVIIGLVGCLPNPYPRASAASCYEL